MIARFLLLLGLLLSGGARAADLLALDWVQKPGASVPVQLPLRDADGRATTLAQAGGGLPLLVAPGYFHCPNLCGAVRDDVFAALAAAGLRPGRDLAVALLTIDPAEGPADAYAAREGVLARHPGLLQDAGGLHALTGPATSLDATAASLGFPSRPDPATRDFAHPAGAVVLTPGGSVSGYLLGLGYGPDALRAAIALARQGGSAPAEPVHLFCFTYNPATGRFSATALQLVRGAALLTVAALAVLLRRGLRRA